MPRWWTTWSFLFQFFLPRKSTSSEDFFPLSFVGRSDSTGNLLFLDAILSCPDPVVLRVLCNRGPSNYLIYPPFSRKKNVFSSQATELP